MTANPERGEVDLTIGGKSYVLAMGFNGLIALQNLFAVDGVKPTVDAILQRMTRGDFEAFRGVFWALFLRHHKDVTIERAGELMDEIGGMDALDGLLTRAMEQGHPDPDDTKALGAASRRPQKAAQSRRGTGGKSR